MAKNLTGSPEQINPQLNRKAGRGFFLLAALGGFAGLAFLFSTPSESTSSIIFGLSFLRLVIALAITVFSLASILVLIAAWRSPGRFDQRLDQFLQRLNKPIPWAISIFVCLTIFLTGLFFITLTPEIQEPFTRAYFERLLPAVLWLVLMSGLALLFLLIARYGSRPFQWLPRSRSFYIPLVVFGIFYFGWVFIARPRLPTETQITGWNIISAPILDTQMVLAWAAGILMVIGWYALLKRYPDISAKRLSFAQKIDILIFILFWIISALLWRSIPIHSNWFVSEPTSPNQEFYPTSDARIYDITAQTALVGSGFRFFDTPFIRRPLHAAYLTILHLIAGQNYTSVVSLQIVLLALLPPMIYLLAKSLHDRPAGVIAALLVMLREANSISISGRITTSHAKELLVDLPTTLGMVIFTLIVIKWFKQFNLRREYALIAGGFLGIVLLIRLEMVVGFLIIAAIAYLISRASKTRFIWLKAMLLFSLGTSLVILPWVFRNWSLTGQFFLDSPLWRADLIQQRFRPFGQPTATIPAAGPIGLAPGASPTVPTGQVVSTPSTTGAQPAVQPTVVTIESETTRAMRYVTSNPGEVAGFIITHYLNSQMQSFLILPTTLRLLDSLTAYFGHRSPQRLWYGCCSAVDYIRRLPYWHKWDGSIPSQAVVPFIANILLIAAGIHITWKNHHWIGLVPALIGAAHFLFNALFRNSGGRYILPVDWVGIVYFSIGLSFVTTRFLGHFLNFTGSDKWAVDEKNRASISADRPVPLSTSLLFAYAGLFILVGLSIPITEVLFNNIYTDARQKEMYDSLIQSPTLSPSERSFLGSFMSQGGEYIAGRGLYPEFLPANSDEGAKNKYLPAPFPRFSFYLVGADSKAILMPIDKRPKYFPNAADVIVIGCPVINPAFGTRQMDVLLIGVFGSNGDVETFIPRFPAAIEPRCPLPSPLPRYSGNLP
jgi:hypothetical protein